MINRRTYLGGAAVVLCREGTSTETGSLVARCPIFCVRGTIERCLTDNSFYLKRQNTPPLKTKIHVCRHKHQPKPPSSNNHETTTACGSCSCKREWVREGLVRIYHHIQQQSPLEQKIFAG